MNRWNRALMFRDDRMLSRSARFLVFELLAFSGCVGVLKNSIAFALIALSVLSVLVLIRLTSHFVGVLFTVLWFAIVYKLALGLTAMPDAAIAIGLAAACLAGFLNYFAMRYSSTLFQR